MKLTVTLAEAPSDVLAFLVDNPGGVTRETVVTAMIGRVGLDELDREDITRITAQALRLLHELKFAGTSGGGESRLLWHTTRDGREAIGDARAAEGKPS